MLFTLWVGLLAPAGTPETIVMRLSGETAAAAQLKEVNERLLGEGAEAYPTDPRRMREVIRDETSKWAQVVKAAKIAPQ